MIGKVLGLIVTLASIFLVACAGSLHASTAMHALAATSTATSERCAELDDRRAISGAVAKGAAVIAGASGLSTLPLEGDRYTEARIGVAAGGIAAAAVAAAAIVVSESAGESFVRECQ